MEAKIKEDLEQKLKLPNFIIICGDGQLDNFKQAKDYFFNTNPKISLPYLFIHIPFFWNKDISSLEHEINKELND